MMVLTYFSLTRASETDQNQSLPWAEGTIVSTGVYEIFLGKKQILTQRV